MYKRQILRPGPISAEMLRDLLEGRPIGLREQPKETSTGLSSPGQLPVHYAPTARAVRIEASHPLEPNPFAGRYALLELGPAREPRALDPQPVAYTRFASPEEASRRLYDVLHHFDDLAPDLIVVLMPPDLPEWSAVRDRLMRATVPLAT